MRRLDDELHVVVEIVLEHAETVDDALRLMSRDTAIQAPFRFCNL